MTENSTKMKEFKSSNKLIKIRWGKKWEVKISLTGMLAMDLQILIKINTENARIILYSNPATVNRLMELHLELRKQPISKMMRNRR